MFATRLTSQLAQGFRGSNTARRVKPSAEAGEARHTAHIAAGKRPPASRFLHGSALHACKAPPGTTQPMSSPVRSPLLNNPLNSGTFTTLTNATKTPANSNPSNVRPPQGKHVFQQFLEKHEALGVGILSGLGLLLCFGVQLGKEALDSRLSDWLHADDDDDDEEIQTKYHLEYELNSKAYDALALNDPTLPEAFNSAEALANYLASPMPEYAYTQKALITQKPIPAPSPIDYGLWAACDARALSPSTRNISSEQQSVCVPPIKAPSPVKLSPMEATSATRATNNAPLDYQQLATKVGEKHAAFRTACQRIEKMNFHRQLHNEVLAFQHTCFLKNVPWQHAMPLAKAQLSKTLLKTDPYARDNPMLARAAMNRRLMQVSYSVHAQGGRFKAHKHTEHPLATHTQIRSASGKVYALLNELSDEDSEALLTQFGIAKSGSFVLGEGMFGKVRLAQDMETGKIVAVKKMFSRYMANLEIEEFKGIPPDDHLVSLYDHAHVRTSDGDNKSYLFMELVGDVNGTALVNALAVRRKQGQRRALEKLLNQAVLECSVAVVKLHELGIYHCDIKPENFIISHKAIHLGDYGLATKDKRTHPGSTLAYNPQDKTYDAEKHDAFALGITFYELMHGKHPADLDDSPKTENTESLAGKTLEECVAKLRDADANKRITVKQFLQLPYIQKLMSPQQRAAARELVFFAGEGRQQ